MKNSCAATGSLKSSRKGSFCSAGEQSLRAFGVEKKMKRIYLTIIAVLSGLSAFLALYALGIFDFGRFSAVDEPSQFASERSERVTASSVWRIAVLGSYTDELYVAEAAPGIGRMALMINMKGGILGKPVKVSYVEPQEDSYETRLAAQKISQDPEVAYLLGPMSTAHVREVRTLSQYHALPALAPLSPSEPDLPVLEPDTWIRVVGRVQGANFGAIYGSTKALGARKFTLPPGHTWRSYVKFLLATLPESIRQNYINKFKTSIRFWWKKGGVVNEDALKELEECNYPIRRNGPSGYNKSRDKIRFLGTPDNTDDIKSTIDIPSWKRMAVCILKNDHLCKYMGFTQTKKQAERERELMAKYRNL